MVSWLRKLRERISPAPQAISTAAVSISWANSGETAGDGEDMEGLLGGGYAIWQVQGMGVVKYSIGIGAFSFQGSRAPSPSWVTCLRLLARSVLEKAGVRWGIHPPNPRMNWGLRADSLRDTLGRDFVRRSGAALKRTFPLFSIMAVAVGLLALACASPAAPPEAAEAVDPEIPVIVEFADFQCGYCAQFALKTLPLLQRDIVDQGIARFEYRHFPFLSPESTTAAEASECARDQGMFMDYHNGVYDLLARREGMGPDNLRGVAEVLGLDLAEFDACARDRVHRERVQADKEYGRKLGVRGTPAFLHRRGGAGLVQLP